MSSWTTSGETSFFWKKLSFSFYFRILRKKNLDIQRGKSELHLTCLESKIGGTRCFFGIVTILNFCLDFDGNTIESSAKNFLVGPPNCLVRVQTKDSNEVTFFRTFLFQSLSQTLSGKYPAVVSKTNSTCPEEPMENEVLRWNSLIPQNVFAIRRRCFGLRLNNFTMVVNTAFYSLTEKKTQPEFFRNEFCFSMVTGLWVKLFLSFGQLFPKVVNSAIYTSRGIILR